MCTCIPKGVDPDNFMYYDNTKLLVNLRGGKCFIGEGGGGGGGLESRVPSPRQCSLIHVPYQIHVWGTHSRNGTLCQFGQVFCMDVV